jgi:hypothetical protein
VATKTPESGSSGGRAATRRRHTAKAPARSDWEAAFQKVESMPAKASEDTAAEFLPKFVAALREKGFVQNEVVERIMALKLGVTDRQIRDADKAYRKAHPAPVVPASGAPAAAAPAPAATAQTPVPAAPPSGPHVAVRSTHAGFQQDEGLHTR